MHYASQDITDSKALKGLLTRVRNREFDAVMLGTPCASFSVARDRTRQIRSVREPWGLSDRTGWSQKDLKSIEIGNKIAKASIRILNLLLELRIPAIF